MKQFITSCVVPAKSDCEKCLRAEPEALKNRDWQTLKFYVYNRITAYKRKVQRNQYVVTNEHAGTVVLLYIQISQQNTGVECISSYCCYCYCLLKFIKIKYAI